MTNYEYYKDDITKIIGKDDHVAVSLKDYSVHKCSCFADCTKCYFFKDKENTNCDHGLLKWMFQQKIEQVKNVESVKINRDNKPMLTKMERDFCEYARNGYLVRDKNGYLNYFYYSEKYFPTKKVDRGCWSEDRTYISLNYPIISSYKRQNARKRIYVELDFPFITWEDEKPWSIEDLLKLDVYEESSQENTDKDVKEDVSQVIEDLEKYICKLKKYL